MPGLIELRCRFTQVDFLITKFRGLGWITLRREFEICARQRRSRESITKETILAPCRTTVPTFQSEFITFYFLHLKLYFVIYLKPMTTWFCFRCAVFKRSISGSLKVENRGTTTYNRSFASPLSDACF